MTLVQDYSRVAVIEMLAVLRKMREHCGPEFQITNRKIGKTLRERFGLVMTYQGKGRVLLQHVIDTLIERGVLEVWDVRTRNHSVVTIYQVKADALIHNV